MDPLRDPLHDSVIDEALADPGTAGTEEAPAMMVTTGASAEETAASSDGESPEGSVYSSLTAALAADAAAEPVPYDPAAPPAGPPAPTPLHCPARTIGPMPGEHSVDGPAWHRSLVQNVLQHLGCSAPAFLSAPSTLAEVHSWNALHISISEAGPADYLRGLPIEIQDADSTLFLDSAVVDTGDGGEDTELGETAESEDHEHDSPLSPPDGDDAEEGGDAGASGSRLVGPQASSSSRPRPRSSSRSRSPRGASGGPGTTRMSSVLRPRPWRSWTQEIHYI